MEIFGVRIYAYLQHILFQLGQQSVLILAAIFFCLDLSLSTKMNISFSHI